MKTPSKLVLPLLFLAIFMMAGANVTYAADQLPSDAPPQLNKLDEEAPAVTSSKKENKQQTIQTIQRGEQTEVRVTNEIGTYIVKPNQSVGTSLPGDVQSSSNHPVGWIVKSWGGSKNSDPTAAPPESQEKPEKPDNPDSK